MSIKLNLRNWLWLVLLGLASVSRAADPNAGLGTNDPATMPPPPTNAPPKQLQEYYELKAERGDCAAAVQLACWNLWDGFPGEVLLANKGVYWLSFAAQHNYVPAYRLVARVYAEGANGCVPVDLNQARKWYEKGAAENDLDCYLELGRLELTSNPSHPNIEAARAWIRKAADKGFPSALYEMGRLAEFLGVQHDPSVQPNYAEAADWYHRAAASNHLWAAERLVYLAWHNYIREDLIRLLQQASDLNSSAARLELAQRYINGTAKPRSTNDTPVKLLESLVARGDQSAEVTLSDLYRVGRLVPKDPIRSIYLLHSASRAKRMGRDAGAWEILSDVAEACRQHRKPDHDDEGLETDYPRYRRAFVETGNAQLAADIGHDYLNGVYPKDDVSACAWLSLAANRNPQFSADRDALYQKLNDDQKRQVDRMMGVLTLPPAWMNLP